MLLLEDDRGLAHSVASVLAERGHRVESAHSLRDGAEALKRATYAVAILDIHLPDGSGIDLVEPARAAGAAVLMWTVDAQSASVTHALSAGAAGYALKDASPEELEWAMRTALRGARFLSERACQALVTPADPSPRLTPRERELVVALARGLTYAEVATSLSIGVGTVQRYVKHVYAKLNVNSKTELAALAARSGWIDGAT